MDPLTQILAIIQTLCETYKLWLESLPPDKRAEVAAMQVDDIRQWRAFFARLTPKYGGGGEAGSSTPH